MAKETKIDVQEIFKSADPTFEDAGAPVIAVDEDGSNVKEARELVVARSKDSAVKSAVATKAERALEQVFKHDVDSPDFLKAVEGIFAIGESEMTKVGNFSGQILERQVRNSKRDKKSGGNPAEKISEDLVKFRNVMADLDPNKANLKGWKRILRALPFGQDVDAYFSRYATAQDLLNDIKDSLNSSVVGLTNDNQDMLRLGQALYQTNANLGDYILMLEEMDKRIAEEVRDAEEAGDAERAVAIKQNAGSAVRNRLQDVQTQLALGMQGQVSLAILMNNNSELIRGVKRAHQITESGVKVAIIIAQALGAQEDVLRQLEANRKFTSNIILANAKRLQQQGAKIHELSNQPAIEIEKLEQAWQYNFQAIEEAKQANERAYDSAGETIERLRSVISTAQERMKNHQGYMEITSK